LFDIEQAGDYSHFMETIHTSEAEATRDIAGLLRRARAGAKVVIEDDAVPALVLHLATEPVDAPPPLRRLSESLRIAEQQEELQRVGDDFADDIEDGINSRRQPLNNPWD
jgi:antitoxin (DNA-binding transcriptional repressor) of toxin-antitoxin stability system